MARETRVTRRVRDAAGAWWQVSEGYSWEPLRQSEPSAYLVFRGAGREVKAQGGGPLEQMDDARLAAILSAATAAADAAADRPSAPALRLTRRARIPGSLRMFPAFAAGG
jgi:hypothetical protein